MANRRFQSSISRGEVLRWLIPFCTLVALSLVGVLEVFHGNRPLLLLIFLAVFLSGLAVLASEFLHSRTVLREARFARDTLHKAMLAGNSVAWDLDVRTGEDNWFGDLKTMFGIPSETFTTRLGDFYKRVHPDDRRRVSQAV